MPQQPLFTVIQVEEDPQVLSDACAYLELHFQQQQTRSRLHQPQTPNVMVPRSPEQSRTHHSQSQTPTICEQQSSPLLNHKDDEDNSLESNASPRSSEQTLPLRTLRSDAPQQSTDTLTTTTTQQQSHIRSDLPIAQPRPRNLSPRARANLRSRSSNTTIATSSMTPRAHSLPARTPSPFSMGSPHRTGSPFRPNVDEPQHPASLSPPLYDGGFEVIREDSELDLTRSSSERGLQPSTLYSNASRGLANRRQRPTSPLRGFATTSPSLTTPSTATPISSSTSSPFLPPQKYNEAFPSLHHYASTSSFSSMPSTPSTNRSRSPSISSLGTIEDAPDQEWEATEEERIAKLKAAADEEDQNGQSEGRRRSSLEIPRPGAGFGFGRSNQRKRWSVCGAERRADLDLETIWED